MMFNFIRQFRLRKDQTTLRWIAFDTQFKPGDNDDTFKHWTTKGITAIGTVIENKELQSFQILKDKFALQNRDLSRYIQFRDYYNKEVKIENTQETNYVINVMLSAYKPNSNRTKVI